MFGFIIFIANLLALIGNIFSAYQGYIFNGFLIPVNVFIAYRLLDHKDYW